MVGSIGSDRIAESCGQVGKFAGGSNRDNADYYLIFIEIFFFEFTNHLFQNNEPKWPKIIKFIATMQKFRQIRKLFTTPAFFPFWRLNFVGPTRKE